MISFTNFLLVSLSAIPQDCAFKLRLPFFSALVFLLDLLAPNDRIILNYRSTSETNLKDYAENLNRADQKVNYSQISLSFLLVIGTYFGCIEYNAWSLFQEQIRSGNELYLCIHTIHGLNLL